MARKALSNRGNACNRCLLSGLEANMPAPGVKPGVNADLNKGWTGWANLGYLWGSQRYQSISARTGAMYTW